MALDPATGDLWATENGPLSMDEINRIEPGMNGGWRRIVGPDSRHPAGEEHLFTMPGGGSFYSDPEFSWFQPIGVTSIVFALGSALGANYDSHALVGDNNNGQLYALPLDEARENFDFSAFPDLEDLVADGLDGTERDQLLFGEGFGIVTDLAIGPDGALYVASLTEGAIYRIAAACPDTPSECRKPVAPGRATVAITNESGGERDRLVWKWRPGAATTTADFADPTATDDYTFCLYDGSGLMTRARIEAGADCAGKPCWRATADGYRMKDKTAAFGGIERLTLRGGAEGKASIILRGRGENLDPPDLTNLMSPFTLELRHGSGTECWSATYSFPPERRHTATKFRDRAD